MPAQSHISYRVLVRLLAFAGFLLAVGYLFVRVFLPDGRLVVTTDLVHPAAYVGIPKPSTRVEAANQAADGSSRTLVTGDPVYLDVTPPSRFDSVSVTVRYENDGNAAVELGGLASALDQQYDVRPLEQRLLDGLPWRRLSSGTLSLYDRTGRYASVDEFLRDPPPRGRVAAYRAAVPVPYHLEGYQPLAATRQAEVSLRGSQRMLTYVQGEPLNFTFVVQDMNRQAGADPVIVSVYPENGDQPVARTVLADDGNATDDQKSSPLRQIPVQVTAPAEGVYAVVFTAPADVFIRKIVTRQRKLVFADSLYLGDHVGYSPVTPPITVYTDATRIKARTAHAESLQDVTFGGSRITIAEPNLAYPAADDHEGLAPITSTKRDVLLEANGLFALSPDEWFDGRPYGIPWYATPQDLAGRGIDAILADYEPPTTTNGLTAATATFALSGLAKTETGAYRFALSVPGIEDTRHPFRVASVSFAFRRPPITLSTALPSILAAFQPPAPQPEPALLPNGRSYGETLP